MKCNSCGVENQEGGKYCGACGTPVNIDRSQKLDQSEGMADEKLSSEDLQEERAEVVSLEKTEDPIKNESQQLEQEHDKSSKMSMILMGTAASIILLCLLFISIRPQSVSYNGGQSNAGIYIYYSPKEEESYVFLNHKQMEQTISGLVTEIEKDLYDSSAALLDEEKTLYFVSAKGIEQVADDVERFVLSIEGTGLVYLDSDSRLSLYNCSTGKSEVITDGVVEEREDSISYAYTRPLVISPDGKKVLFNYIDEDGEIELMMYTNEKISSLGKDLYAVSTSNKGEGIFAYHELKDSLYYISADQNKQKIASDVDSDSFELNVDQTEIVFTRNNENYYYKAGQDKVKFDKSYYFWFLPAKNSDLVFNSSNVHYSVTHSWDSFKNQLYSAESNVSLLTAELKSKRLARGSDILDATVIGNLLFYIKNGDLYSIGINSEDKANKLVKNVTSFTVSQDAKHIYFTDKESTLWYQAGDQQAEEVMKDVKSFVLDEKGNLYFTVADSEDLEVHLIDSIYYDYYDNDVNESLAFFSSSLGNNVIQLAEDINSFSVLKDGSVVYQENAGTDGFFNVYNIYCSKDGQNFEQIFEKVYELTGY